ncbi:sugar ABC transporter substrate-binding protein [Pseudarthrobacter sp. MDT3-28]|uniref:sugar ABC transporter substrate-binding protein n=1 Tax=Pseudarthrobacter raffinosi TaxID=2953651 RepID=UPI00208EE938|nr:substrate-binding domain-containing protein [Pseudarthrobacter sp. MDT3-28]MCO4239522.1 sugar ABC transporter substrate-binding protein [Pseudarthrobacter sp. MDT3-28]
MHHPYLATWRKIAVAVLAAGLISTTAACGTNGNPSPGANAGTQAAGTGSIDGGGALLKVFMPSTSNVYLAAASQSIKDEAKSLNYTVNIVENNWDQTEQDQQVQEWLATGERAAAVLMWPAGAAAATNSIRLLSAQAPVIQFNNLVTPEASKYVKAYAGVSDTGIGKEAALNALAAVEKLKAEGVKFHGPDGKPNVVEIRFTAGYAAGDDREKAFAEATPGAFNVLAVEPTPTVDAQGGFKAASQVIPRFLGQGIDIVYAHSNDVANGVVQALEQNGLKPGKDVILITGTSSGDMTNLRSGKIWSATLQSPVIEGALVVRTAAQYIATGQVQPGEVTIESSSNKPELKVEAPHTATYMMNPQVTAENNDSFDIWGLSFDKLMGK